jgi:hypothetical protein
VSNIFRRRYGLQLPSLEQLATWKEIRRAYQSLEKIRERLPLYTPGQLEKFRAQFKAPDPNSPIGQLIAQEQALRDQEIAEEQRAIEEEVRQREAEKARRREERRHRREERRKLIEENRQREEEAAQAREAEEEAARQREEEEQRARTANKNKRGRGQPRKEIPHLDEALEALVQEIRGKRVLPPPKKLRDFVIDFLRNNHGVRVDEEKQAKTIDRRIKNWLDACSGKKSEQEG